MTNWEYWPFHALYFPVFFQWAFYALRQKSLFFFNACNPAIKNGGFFMESKKQIYDLLPENCYPITVLVPQKTSLAAVEKKFNDNEFRFPLIAKPDVGLRGSAVKKLETVQDLQNYWHKADFDFVVQNLIPFPNEMGIFYVRYPDQKMGKITGIVSKEFLVVTGNGHDTIEQLLKQNPRFELQLATLKKEYGVKLQQVLDKDVKLNLVPFGNHARGAKFLDDSHLISQKMTDVMNNICLEIEGFYFGRLDIMYHSIDDFENGKNFSIVELNGAGSEPTHIYDPKHSLFFAWQELSRHLRMMYEISTINHKSGHPYLSKKIGMQQYRLHLLQSKKIISF